MKTILQMPTKTLLFIMAMFFVGMFSGAFVYSKFFLSKKLSSNDKISVNYPLPTILEEVRPTSKNAEGFNIILLGSGGAGHSGGTLADSIIVVHVNTTDKKASLISIPRDLWFSGHKINSDPSIKDAVTGITGLSISNYISIDFSSFINMIDSLNGVEVDVKKAYVDNFYPVKGLENELCGKSPQEVADLHSKYSGFELEKQFTCRYETINYKVGLNHMSGSDALKYVRSRHGDSDFGRSRRQVEILKAILQKANIASIDKAFDFVSTDLNGDKVKDYLSKIGNPLEYSVTNFQLSDENVLVNSKSSQGAYILIPKDGEGKFGGVKNFVLNNI